jgi:pimeloyl-ACP methyl ester carboxylesterase
VYDNFATALQSVGHAVLVPDLRGHGGSVATVMNLRLDHTVMKGAAFANMYRDVDAAKKFLFAENNEGRLNIELLTVLGADLSAVVATNWAGRDWSWPQLPAYKQGRDVKCLILLSPTLNFNGYRAALKHPIFRTPLPLIMMAVGTRDSEALEQAEGIYKILERSRAGAPNTIKLVKADTELQGADLLTFRNLRVDHQAALFIFENIAKNVASFPWRERRSPLDVGDDDAP